MTTINTINMQATKREAAEKIAELIRDYYTGSSSPITIGITEEGEIDSWHTVHGTRGMVVQFDDTEGGWAYGDFDGDPSNPDDWDDGEQEALAEAWLYGWIDDALARTANEHVDVVWTQE